MRAETIKGLIIAEIPHLRRYAMALLRHGDAADELVQQCLERALARHFLWRRKESLRPWLFRILYNLHVNNQKHRGRRRAMFISASTLPEAPQPALQDQYVECRNIAQAMDRLPSEQRAAILLVALEGMSYDEAAGILGVPTGTLRSRLFRGRETLRLLLNMHTERPRLKRVK
jgi:RNA polymerase sigma-70 factor (ECF subfamily)